MCVDRSLPLSSWSLHPPLRGGFPPRGKRKKGHPSLFAVGLVLAVLSGASIAGAAPRSPPPAHAAPFPGDPWERSNRVGFEAEKTLDRVLIWPITKVNKTLTPGILGKGLHNFLVNLQEPLVAANDMLQLRPVRALKAALRFVFNSTFGLAGTIDISAKAGVPHHKSSFGDTLGRYGVGPGPYLFLPLVGPSSVRDLFGNLVDDFIDPVYLANYPYRAAASIALPVLNGLDQRILNNEDLRALMSDAADPYATLRSTYLQNRVGEINGDKPVLNALPELDDPGASPAAAPQPPRPIRPRRPPPTPPSDSPPIRPPSAASDVPIRRHAGGFRQPGSGPAGDGPRAPARRSGWARRWQGPARV